MREPQTAEAECLHLGERPIGLPEVAADAVTRHHHAGAFRAALAVDEHLPIRVVVNQLQELRDLSRVRILFTAPRNADITHALRFHQRTLAGDFDGLMPQVNDDVDAELLQLRKAGILRLSAAIKLAVDNAEVPQPGALRRLRTGLTRDGHAHRGREEDRCPKEGKRHPGYFAPKQYTELRVRT